jgi:hypothetical protein
MKTLDVGEESTESPDHLANIHVPFNAATGGAT